MSGIQLLPELLAIIENYQKPFVLNEQWVNGEDYYQINTKRDSIHTSKHRLIYYMHNICAEQPATYMYEINVMSKDKIKIEIEYPEVRDDVSYETRDSCTGAFKILLLSGSGRVMRSWEIPKTKGGFYDFDQSKRYMQFIVNAIPGRYVLKYWGLNCNDCWHRVRVSSIKGIKSVGICRIKKRKN